jgi:hypothetical protein
LNDAQELREKHKNQKIPLLVQWGVVNKKRTKKTFASALSSASAACFYAATDYNRIVRRSGGSTAEEQLAKEYIGSTEMPA